MFDFVGRRKLFFTISIALVVITILATVIFGVRLDITFKGGAIMSYAYDGNVDKEAFRSVVGSVLSGNFNIQEQQDAISGSSNYVVSLASSDGINASVEASLLDQLQQTFPENNIEALSVSVVNPIIGGEFLAKSLVAVALAAVLMVIYVAIRFKKIGGWSAGVMAVVALLHDVMVVFATFVIFHFSIDQNFIAVVLTILGYSLNDTIVIYDRIRENSRLNSGKMELGEIVNLSLNQSFRRTLMTTVTTVSAMIVVSVVCYLFNVPSILTFSVPMIMGLISGFYSSTCLSSPLWYAWQLKKGKK